MPLKYTQPEYRVSRITPNEYRDNIVSHLTSYHIYRQKFLILAQANS